MRFVTRRVGVLALAAAALLVLASASSANVVGPGKTKLKPDQATFEGFADMGIAVETTGQAEFKPTGAKFPILGGDVAPDAGFQGIIGHAGGLEFTRDDGASVKFKKLTIIVRRVGIKLFATSDHVTVKLAELDGNVAGTESSMQIKDAEASLAKQSAEILTETFDFPFRKDIPLGTTTTKAQVGGPVEE